MARVYKTRVLEAARETGRPLLGSIGAELNDIQKTKAKKKINRGPSHKATYKRRDMKAEK